MRVNGCEMSGSCLVICLLLFGSQFVWIHAASEEPTVVDVLDDSPRCTDHTHVPLRSTVKLRCGEDEVWNRGGIVEVNWYDGRNRDVSAALDDNVVISHKKRQVTIGKVMANHRGRWACRIFSCNNTANTRCVRRQEYGPKYACIEPLAPPRAEFNPVTPSYVLAGQELIISCLTGGDIPLNTTFRLNKTHTYYSTSGSGRFVLPEATQQDQGTLECIVHNSKLNDTAVATKEIIVLTPPRVVSRPKIVKVYEGTTVSLSCEGVDVDADVQPVTYLINPRRTKRLCNGSPRLSQMVHPHLSQPTLGPNSIESSETLKIGAIRMSHSGTYYCEAVTPVLSHCLADESQTTMEVSVLDFPPRSRLEISAGSSYRPLERIVRLAGRISSSDAENRLWLQCVTTNDITLHNKPLTTLWYHNGTLMEITRDNTLLFSFGRRNSSLVFHELLPDMSGFYSCSVNYEGFPDANVTRTNPVEVFVQIPPATEIIASHLDTVYAVGDNFNATCSIVSGNGHRMFTQWMRKVNNVTYPLPLLRSTTGVSKLDLSNLNVRDGGEYVCMGTDPDLRDPALMSHVTTMRLIVREPVGFSPAETTLDTEPVSPTHESTADVNSSSDDVQLAGAGSSRITDDKMYLVVAIVGAVIALLLVVLIVIFLVFVKRRSATTTVAQSKPADKERGSVEQLSNSTGSNPARVTKVSSVPNNLKVLDNPNYESLACSRSASEKSDEKKGDSATVSSGSRDDGIADCPRYVEVDAETSELMSPNGPVPTVVVMSSSGRGTPKTSASVRAIRTPVPSRSNTVDTEASDVDSEFYAEPLDRTVHARTSIRSFASAMREEGNRTPRGVILRKVQKASESDTYSLPRDASIQVIDPDDADYSAPSDMRRPNSVFLVDDYSKPRDSPKSKATPENLFIRASVRKAKSGSMSSRYAGGSLGSIQRHSTLADSTERFPHDSTDNLSRSPSPIDDSLYAQPYAEPPSSMDAVYTTLRKNQRYRDICPDNIVLEDKLGSGRFGNVYKGVWTESTVSRLVAVKTLKDGVDPHERLLFFQEAAIMGQFRHRNIVRLFGVVTQGSDLMLVEELMCSDNLRQFLLKRKPDSESGIEVEMQHLLLDMCKGIADGMNYLANRGFVHRDLAARNIMLDLDNICKIGDFGMSRGMESDHYESSGGVIPVKWSAPEAIEYRSFSSASDVWSYGVVLYEIWTFGKCPYAFLENEVVIFKIKDGYRLPRPELCPPPLYALMKDCWEEDKKGRPTFQEILRRLDGPPEALLRMPKMLMANRKTKHTRAEFMPDGAGSDNSDSSLSGKGDQS